MRGAEVAEPRTRGTTAGAPPRLAVGAALVVLAGQGVLSALTRGAELRLGEPTDPGLVGLLEAGQLASHGLFTGLGVGSSNGPLAQLVAVLAWWVGRDAAGAARALVALSVTLAWLGCSLTWRSISGRSISGRSISGRRAQSVVALLLLVVLAARADLDAIPGLGLLYAATRLSRENPRGLRVGLALVAVVAWSPWALAPAASVLAVAFLRGVRGLEGSRRAVTRAAAVLGAGLLLWLLAASALGSVDHLLGSFGAVRFAHASNAAWLFLACALAWSLSRRGRADGDRAPSPVPLLVPAGLLGAIGLGGDPYLLLWPLVPAVLVDVVAAASAPRGERPATRGWSALGWLLAALFCIVGALAPGFRALARARSALVVLPAEPVAIEDAAVRWMARDARDSCVVVVGDLREARVRAGAFGPADPLRAFHGGDALAQAIRAARCERAVLRIDPVAWDRPAGPFFGPELLALVETYRPVRALDRATVALERRPRPVRSSERFSSLAHDVHVTVRVPGSVEIRLPHPVPADALISFEVELAAAGARPSLRVEARGGGEALGEPARLRVAPGYSRVYVPADDRAAAVRWATGARTEQPQADTLVVTLEDGAFVAPSAILRVRDLALHEPPDVEIEREAGCADEAFARWRPRFRSSGRNAFPRDEGFALHPRMGSSAYVEADARPCARSCLFGEIGISEGTTASFEIVASDGAVQTRLASRDLGPGFRQLFEVPLDRWADRAVTLSFVARSEEGARLAMRLPRVAPCVAVRSVVNDLYEGLAEVLPPHAAIELEGDELRLPVWDSLVVPPRVELPLALEGATDPCLAVELSARRHDGPVGVFVGVREGDVLWWLSRLVLEPDEAPVMQEELRLSSFGSSAYLVFSAWPFDARGGGQAVFTRPRIYECDEGARWAF